MRISDWSSDVCSSDLRQHAVLGRHPALALAAQEAGHAVLDAGRAQHAGVAEAHQHRAFGVAGEGALDAHLAQLVGRAAAGAGNGIPGRSEEHTSELQSLMRSSYAVFCLQKTHKPTNQSLMYKSSDNVIITQQHKTH